MRSLNLLWVSVLGFVCAKQRALWYVQNLNWAILPRETLIHRGGEGVQEGGDVWVRDQEQGGGLLEEETLFFSLWNLGSDDSMAGCVGFGTREL